MAKTKLNNANKNVSPSFLSVCCGGYDVEGIFLLHLWNLSRCFRENELSVCTTFICSSPLEKYLLACIKDFQRRCGNLTYNKIAVVLLPIGKSWFKKCCDMPVVHTKKISINSFWYSFDIETIIEMFSVINVCQKKALCHSINAMNKTTRYLVSQILIYL